jgi:hypothetical protein
MLQTRILFALLLGLSVLHAQAVRALEGGYTSGHPDWKKAPPITRPSPAERKREVDARREALAADRARFIARLRRAPDPATDGRVKAKLKEIHQNYGWVPELEMVWGRRDIEAILHGQETMPKTLLAAVVQLKKDLAARGIDFIYMPFPPTPFFQTHLVVDGVGPETEIYPGWTKMMLQFVENDIEVIDTLEAYRAEADNPVLINWVNDFHTAGLGRQIMARALAKRLQRYDFARELSGNRRHWQEAVHEKTGASWPQRITYVNRMFKEYRKSKLSQLPAGTRTWPRKHPKFVAILREGAPDLTDVLKRRKFKYLELKRSNRVQPQTHGRLDLVMIGDSQLHTPVHGAGLPEFIFAETGGLFRWGSKSWHGFSPPEIYRTVVPDDAPQPRVVVMCSLAKYFWNSYRRGKMRENTRYKPRPLPPLPKASRVAQDQSGGTMTARIRITGISKQPDPRKLDYDEALMHNSAVIVGGPRDGEEIGVRYWAMRDGHAIRTAGRVRPGHTFVATLQPWRDAIRANGKLAQHMVFDDVEQDLLIPVYWIKKGPLDPAHLIGKR